MSRTETISESRLNQLEDVTRNFGITPATGLELIRMLRESQVAIREAVKRLTNLTGSSVTAVPELKEIHAIRDLLAGSLPQEVSNG